MNVICAVPKISSFDLFAVLRLIATFSCSTWSSSMIAILSLMSVIDAPESAKTCKYLASIIIAIITAPKWLFADPSEIAARVVTVNSSSPVSSTVMLMLMHECSNVSVICLIRSGVAICLDWDVIFRCYCWLLDEP